MGWILIITFIDFSYGVNIEHIRVTSKQKCEYIAKVHASKYDKRFVNEHIKYICVEDNLILKD